MTGKWRIYSDSPEPIAKWEAYQAKRQEDYCDWTSHTSSCNYCHHWQYRTPPMPAPKCDSGRKILEQLFFKRGEIVKWPYGDPPNPGYIYAPYIPENL